MSRGNQSIRINRRQVVLGAILLLGLYVLLPQFGQFKASWQVVRNVQFEWLAAAVVFVAGTYLAAAATYCFLSFKPIPYGRTVLVQLAAMFVNRLLPAGVGALGTNFAYLKRYKHTNAQAASIVAINNSLGILGHSLVIVVSAWLGAEALNVPRQNHSSSFEIAVAALIVVAVIAALILLIRNKDRLRQILAELGAQLSLYARKPWRLPLGLSSSITLTLCNVMALYCCATALGVDLPFLSVLIIFSAGVAAGTVTPTPGGLGGFEAGLVAGMIAYHIDSATALAVALLFRLLSYWLAMGVGAAAFIAAQKKGLLKL